MIILTINKKANVIITIIINYIVYSWDNWTFLYSMLAKYRQVFTLIFIC